MKTHGIDAQKWTLAFILYDMHVCGVHLIRSFRVNIMRSFLRTYDAHLLHNPNPTHRVVNTYTSQFCISIAELLFLFGVVFMRTIMRSGWLVYIKM